MTASFGCAGRANEATNRNFEDLVKRADLALYAAKASGRNCVVSGPIIQAPVQEERRKAASGGGFDSAYEKRRISQRRFGVFQRAYLPSIC